MSCACGGLGVYIGGSASAYHLETCPTHPLLPNQGEHIASDDVAPLRVDECLTALAIMKRLLWPEGQKNKLPPADTVERIRQALGFLAPGPGVAEVPPEPDFLVRPVVRILDVRKLDGEAALLGHVYLYGVMHHAWFVEVEEQDGDQVAVDDPFNRLEEFQQLDADAGRFQTVEVPGFSGTYVVVIYPAGD